MAHKHNTGIYEDTIDEVALAFLEADRDAGEEVEVIYIIDSKTGRDLELWRRDWMTVRIDDETD